MGELGSRVQDALNEVVDEETGRRLGELNVVSEVAEEQGGTIRIKFTPLSAYSPTAVELGRRIRDAGVKVDGVTKIVVESRGHMQDELINRLVNGREPSG